MPRTFFQNFFTSRGPVTVEYGFSAGSPTTYSPRFGAEGGDACEVEIVDCWPDARWFDRLCEGANRGEWHHMAAGRYWGRVFRLSQWWFQWWFRPTDDDFENMAAWLAEHHVDEPDEPED